jgi:iron(III) transport system substrate-binding protein
MTKRTYSRLALISFTVMYSTSLSFAAAITAEESLMKINRLPAAERQAALVKEAKNEKTVVWYAPMNREDLRQFTAAFEAEYPFLKVDILTGGPQSLPNRILTERRAGKDNFDILNIRSSALYTLKKAGAIGRYDSPQRRGLRTGFYDKEGYFNGLWASLMVYLFNFHECGSPLRMKGWEQ